MRGYTSRLLLCGELRPELHAAPHDTVALDGDRVDAGRRDLKVVARVSLADVPGEGALQLGVDFSFEEEIVVPVKCKWNVSDQCEG